MTPSGRRRSSAGARRLDPTLDFMQLLWAIEHGLNKKSKRMNTEIGLTGPQRLVLRTASRFPGLSAGDLARIVQLDSATRASH